MFCLCCFVFLFFAGGALVYRGVLGIISCVYSVVEIFMPISSYKVFHIRGCQIILSASF